MEKPECPYIVFKAAGRMFTLNSANVLAIQEMPKIESVPEVPSGVRGIFIFHGDVAPVVDLRTALGESSLCSEAEGFSDMLEARKQDHINWVKKLKESVAEKKPFTLATDPHKCAFGKWYDSYEAPSGNVKLHLSKIDEPHRLLHETAIRAEKCLEEGGSCDINELIAHAEKNYVTNVLSLLEEAKEIMKGSFREMALVLALNGKLCALAVDEVLSIDELEDTGDMSGLNAITNTTLISSVKKSERYPGALVLELNEQALSGYFGL